MSLQIGTISSDTIGVVVERYPSRVLPDRKQAVYNVIGRNGDIVDYYGGTYRQSFNNFTLNYEIYMNAETYGLEKKAREVAAWLYNSPSLGYAEKGYIELQDSYETDCYREGYFIGPVDVESTLARFGRCTISFSCKPQKFLLSGRTPVLLANGPNTYTFTNPTIIGSMRGWSSQPYIEFHNLNGSLSILFNQTDYYLLDILVQGPGDYIIDAENESVKGPNGYDNTILKPYGTYDMPVLYDEIDIVPSGSGITFDATSFVLPRWWML